MAACFPAMRARTVAVLVVAAGLAGCAGGMPLLLGSNSAPGSEPMVHMARGEPRDLMRCLGRQYEAFSSESTVLAVGRVPNLGISESYTEMQPVPLDARVIIHSLLSSISPQVGAVDLSLVDQATVSPALIIEGGILSDTASDSGETSLDVGFPLFGGSIRGKFLSQSKDASLDLILTASRGTDGVSGYGMSSPMTVTFERARGTKHSLGVGIGGVSLGAQPVRRVITSYGGAIELASAHSLATVLGRSWSLPYWTCTDGEVDEEVRDVRVAHYRSIATGGNGVALTYLRLLLAYVGERVSPEETAIMAALEGRMGYRPEAPEDLEAAYWDLALAVASQPPEVIRAARQWEAEQTAGVKHKRRRKRRK